MNQNDHRKLFKGLKVGNMNLKHRIAMAPLTRYRANDRHVHEEVAVEYYGQRATVPGTLLITEATFISQEAGGYTNVPGIWNESQVESWKKVTDAVHSKGSFIFVQLWALGRAADTSYLSDHGFPYLSSSASPLEGKHGSVPREMTVEEIKKYVGFYVKAAENAIKAGFDGVEVHGANGYLVDQFIQDVCNKRTDNYGGSIENRCRFGLEVVEAISKAIGEERTAIRLSPFSPFQGMRMSDPIPTFSYLIENLKKNHPNLAYLHLVEPRVSGAGDWDNQNKEKESSHFAREIWNPKPFFSAGGYTPQAAIDVAEEGDNIVVVFGRYFISNPDLPYRVQKGIPLTPYNRDTFYLKGPHNTQGYVDYPFADNLFLIQ